MAIANSDGSIILSTKVDTSGLNKGMLQMEGKAPGLTKTFSKLGAAIASAFAIQKIIQFSSESASLATQTEASVQRLVDIYGSASDAVGNFIDQNARALGMSKSAAASFSSVYGNLFSAFADQETNAALTNEYLQMTAVVVSKTGRTVEDVQERIRSGLLGNTEAIEDLGIFVNVKTIEMTDAFQRMADGKSWEQLDAYTQQQVRSMAILEQATAKYGDEVADTSATIRNQFNAAYQDFQNSWGQVINTVLIPILEIVTEIMNIATFGLNTIFNLSSKILDESQKNSASINTSVEGQKQLKKAVDDTAKSVKKATAEFDDLQILTSGTADAASDMAVNTETSIIGGENATGGEIATGEVAQETNTMLAGIMAVAGISAVAIGVILLCYGQIAAGIGFVLFGMATFGVAVATLSQTLPSNIKSVLGIISGIIGAALIVIGVILICTEVGIPLGIGLIIAGWTSIGGGVALNWGFISEKVNYVFNTIKESAFLQTGLLVLGIILLFTGASIPAGFSLVLLGISSIGTVVAVNWNYLNDKIQEIWKKIETFWKSHIQPSINDAVEFWEEMYQTHIEPVVEKIGVLFEELWVQYIKPFFEERFPEAFSELEKATKDFWENVLQPILENVGEIFIWLRNHILEPFVDFILENFSDKIKIGLEVAFAVLGFIADNVFNNAINIINSFTKILNFITTVFTTNWGNVWDSVAEKIKTTFNKIIGFFEKGINFIIEKVNSVFSSINNVSGIIASIVGLNGFSFPNFDKIKIPRLAQGAVIPGNREFLAVLGDQPAGQTNIETPLATMVEAFQMALDSRRAYNGNNMEVVLEIDGREFGRAVVEQGNRENRRIGTRLVIV